MHLFRVACQDSKGFQNDRRKQRVSHLHLWFQTPPNRPASNDLAFSQCARLQLAVLLQPISANTTAPFTFCMLAAALSKVRAPAADDAHPTFTPRLFKTGISVLEIWVRLASWNG